MYRDFLVSRHERNDFRCYKQIERLEFFHFRRSRWTIPLFLPIIDSLSNYDTDYLINERYYLIVRNNYIKTSRKTKKVAWNDSTLISHDFSAISRSNFSRTNYQLAKQ